MRGRTSRVIFEWRSAKSVLDVRLETCLVRTPSLPKEKYFMQESTENYLRRTLASSLSSRRFLSVEQMVYWPLIASSKTTILIDLKTRTVFTFCHLETLILRCSFPPSKRDTFYIPSTAETTKPEYLASTSKMRLINSRSTKISIDALWRSYLFKVDSLKLR